MSTAQHKIVPPRTSFERVLFLIKRTCTCHLHYACTLLLFPSPLSHHSCLVKFARIKIALAAWIRLNPVLDGTGNRKYVLYARNCLKPAFRHFRGMVSRIKCQHHIIDLWKALKWEKYPQLFHRWTQKLRKRAKSAILKVWIFG